MRRIRVGILTQSKEWVRTSDIGKGVGRLLLLKLRQTVSDRFVNYVDGLENSRLGPPISQRRRRVLHTRVVDNLFFPFI